MQPHTNKAYSAADIERYHNGTMPAAEAHALEKAALDDPFLSDAIDGYEHTATPAADVAFLKQQLEKQNRKVVPLSGKWPALLRMAALVILVAGFGWLVYKLSGNNTLSSHDMAVQTEAAPPGNAPSNLPQPGADSVSSGTEALVATAPAGGGKEKKAVPKKETAAENESAGMMDQAAVSSRVAVADSVASSKPQMQAAPLPERQEAAMAKRTSGHTFKARVVDVHNKAVPYASVTDVQHSTTTTTDAAGNFSVTAPESNLKVAVTSAGFQQLQTTLHRSNDALKIVLQPATGLLNETAVSAKGKKAAPRNNVRLEAVEPLEGWDYFNAYAHRNLTPPQELHEVAGNRQVALSFDVDTSGTAVNITIEKPLCPSCDSIAVRVIREGSRWKKNTPSGRAKAYIRF